MNLTKTALLLLIFLLSTPVFAGSGSGHVTIDKIRIWKNGDVKVYVKEGDQVNGKENCSSTDNSMAILSVKNNSVRTAGERNIIAQLQRAKNTGNKIAAFFVGCCLDSPCIRTVQIINKTPQKLLSMIDPEETEVTPPEYVFAQFNSTLTPQQMCGQRIPVGCISGATRLANNDPIKFHHGIQAPQTRTRWSFAKIAHKIP